ncbi:pheromone-processing carboxypeptidase KEX1-like [Camellia sinensis]|uniref:pheromone-processing carboxypeptidase KEX1-like n=1 Tax=Camellia sinensis TaxID=4442 RepID=UPI0010367E60|nr:pheromone-processing carboxypeptidase KEX1-like [Camellia sinensis]
MKIDVYSTSVLWYRKPRKTLDDGLTIIEEDVDVYTMICDYEGLDVIQLYAEKGQDPLQVALTGNDMENMDCRDGMQDVGDEEMHNGDGDEGAADEDTEDEEMDNKAWDEEDSDDPDYMDDGNVDSGSEDEDYESDEPGFVGGCRPIIGLDGCHLKGIYGGQLLCALRRDDNNNYFPISWQLLRQKVKILGCGF